MFTFYEGDISFRYDCSGTPKSPIVVGFICTGAKATSLLTYCIVSNLFILTVGRVLGYSGSFILTVGRALGSSGSLY